MKLDSKLFEGLKLTDKDAKNLVGGGDYTLKANDTAVEGGQYDITFNTLDKNGGTSGSDSVNTAMVNDKGIGIGLSPLRP
ncbi:hypothetical protein [Flavobacterium suzhouense]|uniref:Uncharacterized protein n=1 Tax=Flavobacterium suzhouense TaxID=1529638 RepID=A0ABW5NW76_9FLAO